MRASQIASLDHESRQIARSIATLAANADAQARQPEPDIADIYPTGAAPAGVALAVTAPAIVPDVVPSGALLFERLAADPNVPVEKLERLIAMQERIDAYHARADFHAAFAEMQGEIPVITKRGEIVVDGHVRSTYAKHEDIQREIRPILQRHGFALRHRNEYTPDGKLKIIGILSHRSGHHEQDEFVGPADTSGSKNAIQALGSTRSYGMRYTTIALLNITTENVDDDGVAAGQHAPDASAPIGFAAWWTELQTCAGAGFSKLSAAWNGATPAHRGHLLATNRSGWSALRDQAARVDAATRARVSA